MMKAFTNALPVLTLLGVLAACGGGTGELDCYLAGASPEEAQQRMSPHSRLSFSFDGGEGLLCYGSPSARGRAIVGGLVPYGQPWRMGADEPTTIHLSAAAMVGGVHLEPGSYSLYAVPSEGDWQIFINTSYERWGIPIDENVRRSDIGSFSVAPEPSDSTVESLTYAWSDGAIVMEWENTSIRIPVQGMAGMGGM